MLNWKIIKTDGQSEYILFFFILKNPKNIEWIDLIYRFQFARECELAEVFWIKILKNSSFYFELNFAASN